MFKRPNHHRANSKHAARCRQTASLKNGRYAFTDSSGPLLLLRSLNTLRQQEILCDVKFVLDGGQTLCAHRCVLAASCDYFHSMFNHNMKERLMEEIPLSNIELSTLELVVDFIYTGEFEVEKDMVPQVAILADMLHIDSLKNMCTKLMLSETVAGNCLEMYEFGKRFGCDELGKRALSVIGQRFVVVSKLPSFSLLEADSLKEILACPNLKFGSSGEDLAVEVASSWLNGNPNIRSSAFQHKILPELHLWDASPIAVEMLLQSPAVAASTSLCEAVKQACLVTKKRKLVNNIYVGGGFLQSRTGPRCPRLTAVEHTTLDKLLREDAASDNNSVWEFVATLPEEASYVQSFNIQGSMVCLMSTVHTVDFEMQGTSRVESSVYQYNPVTDVWLPIEIEDKLLELIGQCLTTGGSMAYCSINSFLYIIARCKLVRVPIKMEDGDIVIDSFDLLEQNICKFLSVITDQESTVSNQEKTEANLRDFALVMLHSNLYLLGGSDVFSKTETICRSNVFMFETVSGTWNKKADMFEPRACLAAAKMGGKIYAIGGYNQMRLKSAECYDAQLNVWHRIADTDRHHSHFSCAAVGDYILIFGGKSYAFNCGGARKVLNTVEIYDPEKDEWTRGGPLKKSRCMAFAVAL